MVSTAGAAAKGRRPPAPARMGQGPLLHFWREGMCEATPGGSGAGAARHLLQGNGTCAAANGILKGLARLSFKEQQREKRRTSQGPVLEWS